MAREGIGYFHIDIAEVRTEEGKLFLFVAIDRTRKFAVAQLVEKANRKTAWEFLEHFQDAEQPRNRNTIYSRPMRFDMICEANGIGHRLTKPNHPWTNGQVQRMNRQSRAQPLNDTTIKAMTSFEHIWPTSLMRTTSLVASKRSLVSRPTNTSAKSGH